MTTVRDYRGRAVRLTDERRAHILEGAEMGGMERVIEETMRNPQLVISSRSDTKATMNYRYYYGTHVGDKWLCVVIKYGDEDAFVLTAYLTDAPKKGERIWPSE